MTLGVLLAALSLSSSARAVEFGVLGPDEIVVNVGDLVTIDLSLDNQDQSTVQGCSVDLTGIDSSVLSLQSGATARHHFTQFCSSTGCFGGVNSVDNSFFDPDDLTAHYDGGASVTIVSALALSPTSATGANDPGLDGGFDTPSSRDVTLSFLATAAGVVELSVAGEVSDGTSVNPFSGSAPITVTVVPEPGTALLMGLGLVGLAGVGRRADLIPSGRRDDRSSVSSSRRTG